MRFTVLSPNGSGVGLCLRLKKEGHDARIWIANPDQGHNGEGLVTRMDGRDLAGTILADETGFGPLMDRMEFDGASTCCGSTLADRLESDRTFSEKVMKEAGIPVPDSKSFTDWNEAQEYAKNSEHRLVFKPEGELSGTVPSYVTKDNKELSEAMQYFQSKVGTGKVRFTLQEFIEGTAVSTEGWFDGDEWLYPFNRTIERKHFLDGDLGPSGGCTGNLVWSIGAEDPIVEAMLGLSPFLRDHRYRGPLDLNTVVNADGFWGLEFTPRMGWDALPTFLYSLYDGDFGRMLSLLSKGEAKTLEPMPLRPGFGAGIRISTPPWPSEKFPSEPGLPIRGLEESSLSEDFYPYEVMKRDGRLFTSGGVGAIGVMNQWGESPAEAFSRAYVMVKDVKIPDMQYRTDLYEQCFKDYMDLERVLSRKQEGWIGVDLDKTLAKHQTGADEIGPPIPRMVNRVRRWLDEGEDVRIVTARAHREKPDRWEQIARVSDWSRKHLGTALHVTSEKDPAMIELWDDRTVPVEENTGVKAS